MSSEDYGSGLLGKFFPRGGIFGGLLGDDQNAHLALAAELLQARKGDGFGALGRGLMSGMQVRQQSQKTEREQRAAEAQQLFGTYKFLKEQEQQAFAESQLTGRPHQPHPGIAQIESRLMQLSGVPRGSSGPTPQTAQPVLPPMAGGNSPGMPGSLLGARMPSGEAGSADGFNQPAPPNMVQAPGNAPNLQQLIKAANIPEATAIGLIRANRIGDLHKLIAEALKPHNGPGGISSIDPATGEVRILGGNAAPGNVPWALRNGTPTAMPIQGAAEEVARAEGLKAEAVERAKAPYNFNSYPVGAGGAPKIMSTNELVRREQGAPGSRNPVPPGYNGRSPDANARAILAQELRNNPNDPALRREIELRFPDMLQQRGGGLTGANPIESKATEAFNDDFVKNGYRPAMDAAKSADNILARVGALQRNGMLEKSGWGASQKAYAANLIGAFGVKDAQAFAGDAQTFQKFVMDTNWELLNQAKGPQTEGDAQRALQTFAKLENTPNANRFILDFTAATAKLVKEKAAFIDREARGRRGDMAGIEQAWHEQNRSVWDSPEMAKWNGQPKPGAALGPKQVQLPGGKVATFPSEAAATAFRKEMERR